MGINDPQVEVQLKGTNITLRGVQGGKDIQVEPGSHVLVVRRGDFQFETNRLVLRQGQRVTVRVDYIRRQGGRPPGHARTGPSPGAAGQWRNYLARYEATLDQFQQLVKATGYQTVQECVQARKRLF